METRPHEVDFSKIEKLFHGFKEGRLITFGEWFGDMGSTNPCKTPKEFYEDMIIPEIEGEKEHIRLLSPKNRIEYWNHRFGDDYIRMCESAKKLIEENYPEVLR